MPAPCGLAAKAAISQPVPAAPPGHSHRGVRTVRRELHRMAAKRGTAMPPGPILLLVLALLPPGPAAPCSPQPNATRFVCTEPTLRSLPAGLPRTTLAISVEFTALSALPPSALLPVPRLQELHLSSNRPASLPAALLRPAPALRVLDLTNNLLRDLPADTFSSSHCLQHLVLRENRLRALRPAWFQHLPRLLWLDLGSNALAELPPGAFRPLRSLRSLDLARNLLAALPPGALAGLGALERLDLEGNRLLTLPPAAFAPAPALRLLFLQENGLRELPPRIFLPLRHLRVLDLARNRLRALELPPPGPGPALELHLAGNPWHCGCALRALLRSAAPPLSAAADTRCASPAHRRGQEVAAPSGAGGCEDNGDGQQPPGP
ncbi:leucine-rich alpha-2-glycoprotein [Pezoporus flaviventris]|uniref:leucine-rich alpha-2-glycoprotein n=1 Tax=Pezoporus flaviventris TaxID=889875 RepID=UPI002AAF1930|nr:leucine-rich alpha-2-glycoprotein [Pezoporus flaviventris]